MFSPMCDVSPLRLINFCQIKTRAPSPPEATGMWNANMNAVRKTLTRAPVHRPEVVSAQTGYCRPGTGPCQQGISARRVELGSVPGRMTLPTCPHFPRTSPCVLPTAPLPNSSPKLSPFLGASVVPSANWIPWIHPK